MLKEFQYVISFVVRPDGTDGHCLGEWSKLFSEPDIPAPNSWVTIELPVLGLQRLGVTYVVYPINAATPYVQIFSPCLLEPDADYDLIADGLQVEGWYPFSDQWTKRFQENEDDD